MDGFRRSATSTDTCCPNSKKLHMGPTNGGEVNMLLREAFLALCGAAGSYFRNRHFKILEQYSLMLRRILD
jgi:hypothetical protein